MDLRWLVFILAVVSATPVFDIKRLIDQKAVTRFLALQYMPLTDLLALSQELRALIVEHRSNLQLVEYHANSILADGYDRQLFTRKLANGRSMLGIYIDLQRKIRAMLALRTAEVAP